MSRAQARLPHHAQVALAPTLAPTRALLRWLASDPAWSDLPLHRRAMLNWHATWGSVNARLALTADAQSRPPAVLSDPLLILGPWRSGTTVMHELLTAATGLAAPRSWQCMNAAAFATMPRRSGTMEVMRPMDGLPIADDSPQEDEFALLTLGVPTANRAFWQPGRFGELSDTLDPGFWLQCPSWLHAWESFLRGVLRTVPDAREPLILKSPNHTYRLPAIAHRFPRVRAIWMARPAEQVFLSNRKMWHTMFALHGLPGSRADDAALDSFLVQAVDRAAQVLAWCIETLPAAQWVAVSQSRLQAEGEAVTARVVDRLGLPSAPGAGVLRQAMFRVSQGRIDQHAPILLPAQALAACQRLDEVQALALSKRWV